MESTSEIRGNPAKPGVLHRRAKPYVKTCREVGSTKSFRAKVLNNKIWAVHQRAYKKYFARTKKGTMPKPDFLSWETESERLRDKALAEYDRAKTEDEKTAIVERLREALNRR